jgi:predicted DNA-binding WGR domain protein
VLKLYKRTPQSSDYWETWSDGKGTHTVHWGALGTQGQTKQVKSSLFRRAETSIQKEIDRLIAQGFSQLDDEEHATLLIEYNVDGMGSPADLDKRHRLEELMNDTLGQTGLGWCDGGSIGSGSMEVFCYVVDFDLAKRVIERALVGTEFSDYARILDETE